MVATPESKVKDWLANKLKSHFPGMWLYKAPGGRFGRVGVPDFICCIDGLFVAIEVKSDSGVISENQRHELEKVNKAKGIAAVIYGKDEIKLQRILKAINDAKAAGL